MKMSQTLSKINQIASKLNHQLKLKHKPSESTSRWPGWMVRDSHLTHGGLRMTNSLLVLSLILCGVVAGVIATDAQAAPYALSISFVNSSDEDVSNSTIDFNVSPSYAGSFAKSSASTVAVGTTNANGYTLSIASANNNGDKLFLNGDSSSDYLSSITSATTEEVFKALDSTSYNNKWGYLPSKWDGQANTSFLPAPSSSGDVLDHTSTANTVLSNTATDVCKRYQCDKYDITVGARVDTTAKIGSYNNTYVVYATANGTPYTITYKDNTISNMPADESSNAMSGIVNISNLTPTRDGYEFIGWCAGTVVNNSNGTDTCTGTVYQPNGTWTINEGAATNSLTLYAMWSGNYTISKVTTMQELGTASMEKKAKIVSTMVTDTNYTVKDARDNQDYTISKLKDGNIWMTKNLNLAGGATIDATNSDIPATWTLPTANGFQSGNKLPASSTTGFSSDTTAYVYNSGNTNCGTSGNSSPCYSYYSYIAATAGSGLTVTGNGEDAAWSICPKGWRLPLSGNHEITDASNPASYKRGDFYKLATAYGVNLENQYYENSATFYNNLGPGTNANFLLSGYYNGSAFYHGGVNGYYWSATGGSTTSRARDLGFNTGNVNSADYSNRRNGFSVRCILGS